RSARSASASTTRAVPSTSRLTAASIRRPRGPRSPPAPTCWWRVLRPSPAARRATPSTSGGWAPANKSPPTVMTVATGDRRLRYRLWAAYCRTPAHRLRLWGRAPKVLALSLDERWPGDPRRGEAIIEGSYRLAGETVASADPPWDPGLGGLE